MDKTNSSTLALFVPKQERNDATGPCRSRVPHGSGRRDDRIQRKGLTHEGHAVPVIVLCLRPIRADFDTYFRLALRFDGDGLKKADGVTAGCVAGAVCRERQGQHYLLRRLTPCGPGALAKVYGGRCVAISLYRRAGISFFPGGRVSETSVLTQGKHASLRPPKDSSAMERIRAVCTDRISRAAVQRTSANTHSKLTAHCSRISFCGDFWYTGSISVTGKL